MTEGSRKSVEVDPVCGMTVDPAAAKHRAEHAGRELYFCSPGCREKFLGDPEKYVPRQTTDPVCGMTVDPASAKHLAVVGGQTHYFCCEGCKSKFVADPSAFLEKDSAGERTRRDKADAAVSEDAIYTCPMDPEVRQVGPGTCPKCGMALEPAVVTADAAENPEMVDMTRRLWIGAALTLPIFVIAMSEMVPGLEWLERLRATRRDGLAWLQFLLASPVVLWCGLPFFQRGWTSIRTARPISSQRTRCLEMFRCCAGRATSRSRRRSTWRPAPIRSR